MKKQLLSAVLLGIGLTAVPATADIGIGADLVNRYVWRGADFGDAVSVQPSIAYSTDSFEVGAWSSWGITSNGANENDLYVSFNAGPVGITVTDYYFPGGGFLDFGTDGQHIIEVMGSFATGDLSIAAAVNLLNDPENSLWLELGYSLNESVGLSIGLGNGVYTTDTDPMVASVGLNVSQDDYFASYIINPDQETSFLVFGRSF